MILETGEEKGHLGPVQVTIEVQETTKTKLETLSISRILEAKGTVWRTVMILGCRRLSHEMLYPRRGTSPAFV